MYWESTHLAPIYEELADLISTNKNLIIASVDATIHKIPGIPIKGYPSLKFFKKGESPEIVDYSGPRTVDGFITFLKANTRY